MSLFYGLCTGFVVCLPSWLVLRYLSAEAGMLVGLFLVTLLLVMTIYANSDEYTARHSKIIESVGVDCPLGCPRGRPQDTRSSRVGAGAEWRQPDGFQ